MAGRRTTSSVLSAEDRDRELQIARQQWGDLLFDSIREQLTVFLDRTGLRVSNGEIQFLEAALYVSSAGLRRLASIRRRKLASDFHRLLPQSHGEKVGSRSTRP
jgi:hypothetical protein